MAATTQSNQTPDVIVTETGENMTTLEIIELKTMLGTILNSFGRLESKIVKPAATQLCDMELKLRNARRHHLPERCGGDAGWEILLQLDNAERQGRRSFTIDICADTGVPPTTTLRYLTKLDEAGLITRTADPDDGRRTEIRLAPDGQALLATVFSDAVKAMSRQEVITIAPLPVMIG